MSTAPDEPPVPDEPTAPDGPPKPDEPVPPARPTVRELIVELTHIQDELRHGDTGWSQDRAALVYHEARIVNELRARRRQSRVTNSQNFTS